MERFDELQLSSDDDEQGKIINCYLLIKYSLLLIVDDTETHFGGFLRKTKRISNEKEEDDKGLKKTRKQVIEELITKSKLHKVCNVMYAICHLFIYLFVYLSICLSIYLFVYLSLICSSHCSVNVNWRETKLESY